MNSNYLLKLSLIHPKSHNRISKCKDKQNYADDLTRKSDIEQKRNSDKHSTSTVYECNRALLSVPFG